MFSDYVAFSSGDKIESTSPISPAGPLSAGSVPTPPLQQPGWVGSEDSDSSGDDKYDMSQSDAEGVWSPDIEQSFQEALAIYPPCGRRKIILNENGKMYGRNELIARHIKLRTGKNRTRKQISSHIQVLARRKAKEMKLNLNLKNQTAKEKAFQSPTSLSSDHLVSATAIHNETSAVRLSSPVLPVNYSRTCWETGRSEEFQHFVESCQSCDIRHKPPVVTVASPGVISTTATDLAYESRTIEIPHKIRLVEFSAFMEKQHDPENYSQHLFIHIRDLPCYNGDQSLETVDIREICDKFPEDTSGLLEMFEKGPGNAFFLIKFWTDINTEIQDEPSDFYGVNSEFESSEDMIITWSTKVCSFGKVVIEKVKTEYARFENGNFVYRTRRAPMCDYVINFIRKLRKLPEHYMMNSVLEHFSILCAVTNRDTQETLLCVAYVFEVSESERGAQHHIYRLVKG